VPPGAVIGLQRICHSTPDRHFARLAVSTVFDVQELQE
jgi:hypothetical protein